MKHAEGGNYITLNVKIEDLTLISQIEDTNLSQQISGISILFLIKLLIL